MYQLTGMGKTQNASRKMKNRREEIKIMGLILTFSKYRFRALPKNLKKKKALYIILVATWELFVQLLPGECACSPVLYFQRICFQESELSHTREWAHYLSLSPRFLCCTPRVQRKKGHRVGSQCITMGEKRFPSWESLLRENWIRIFLGQLPSSPYVDGLDDLLWPHLERWF